MDFVAPIVINNASTYVQRLHNPHSLLDRDESDDPVTQADYFLKTMNIFIANMGLTFEDISEITIKVISGTTEQQISDILALIYAYFEGVSPSVTVKVVDRLKLPTMRVEIQLEF